LERALLGAIGDVDLRAQARIVQSQGQLELWLHPATEPVEFRAEAGRLICSAKTNPAGPGYHAFLVELLERAGSDLGLKWRWNASDVPDLGDECGYHGSRDFFDLQRQMLAWLQALCREVLDMDDVSNIGVCMPIGTRPLLEAAMHSPMGTWGRDWITMAAEGGDSLRACGQAFFPWWNRGLDASFWHGVGTTLAWTEVAWHPPLDADEQRAVNLTLAAFAKAHALDPSLPLPDLELAELQKLRGGDPEQAVPPRTKGIGFRRGAVAWPLAGGWNIQLPGYWYLQVEDGTHILWFGDRTVRATTFTAEGAARDALLEQVQPETAGGKQFAWRNQVCRARAELQRADDHWQLQAAVARDGAFAFVTITYVDANDEDWALGVARSVG
jgi:hypothetical protein